MSNDKMKEEADRLAELAIEFPGVIGSAVIFFFDDGLDEGMGVSVRMPPKLRCYLPESLRNLAFAIEKENLMDGIASKPVENKSEVLESRTVPRIKKSVL